MRIIMLALQGCYIASASVPIYELDSTWAPAFPDGAHTFSGVGVAFAPDTKASLVFVTQRGNISIDPVLVMNSADGSLVDTWGRNDVAISGEPDPSWGAHGIAVEQLTSKGPNVEHYRIYIEDFFGHTVRMYTGDGRRLATFGTPDVAGNATAPLQFGSVADAYISSSPSTVFASDGDGGTANRVVAFHPVDPPTVLWATPAIYHNPHSITLHAPSGLLVVADREHSELRLLRAEDGRDLGAWDCGLHFGAEGRPFGVRTYFKGGGHSQEPLDLLFIASMDNPQDGRFQRITVVNASGLAAAVAAPYPCRVVQQITIDPDTYSGPHLLGVDAQTADLYVALVSDKPRSTVLRYKCVGC